MKTPLWVSIARLDLGVREIPGAPTTPKIKEWLQRLKAWWTDDETPWCGVAVAAWMQQAGCAVPKHWYRAKGWLNWGEELSGPTMGAVVIFERKGGGHVAIVVGRSYAGDLMCIGGNQGNAVTIAPFDHSRVISYRWPAEHVKDLTDNAWNLPLLASNGQRSSNEA